MQGAAGTLFVTKKDGTLRLIVDARRTNSRFRRPPGVSLCTSESLSRLAVRVPDDFEGDAGDAERLLDSLRIALGAVDVKDAFHRLWNDPGFQSGLGWDKPRLQSLASLAVALTAS